MWKRHTQNLSFPLSVLWTQQGIHLGAPFTAVWWRQHLYHHVAVRAISFTDFLAAGACGAEGHRRAEGMPGADPAVGSTTRSALTTPRLRQLWNGLAWGLEKGESKRQVFDGTCLGWAPLILAHLSEAV